MGLWALCDQIQVVCYVFFVYLTLNYVHLNFLATDAWLYYGLYINWEPRYLKDTLGLIWLQYHKAMNKIDVKGYYCSMAADGLHMTVYHTNGNDAVMMQP